MSGTSQFWGVSNVTQLLPGLYFRQLETELQSNQKNQE